MSGRRSHTAWTTGLLATAAVGITLATTPPATAALGPQAPDSTYAFTAKLDIGGQRGCTATLVDPQWLLTAASCFADDPAHSLTVTAGAPKLKTTATIGRTDLTNTASGAVRDVVDLVPRTDRDLVMAKLAAPVTDITPATVAATAPAAGDELQTVGYGRTHDEWVPDHAHTAAFTTSTVQTTTVELAAKSSDGAICKGDTGGPALRTVAGHTELVAVNSLSWQGGCLGTDATETRTGAVDTRVDDIAGWIQQVRYCTVFANAPWKYAQQMTAGYYTGGSAGGTRHMDLIVQWIDGEVTLYQGGDSNDPARPFTAEHRLAPPNGAWAKTVSIDSANFTGGTTDGLVVRWNDGKITQYTTVDANGFHGEKQLAAPNATWQNARQMTVGRYTPGGRRDDLVVVWKDGETSLYTDLATNGIKRETQLEKRNTTWTYADQITAGEFTGKNTGDLLVRWKDGETTIYPGLTAKGIPAEIKIQKAKSAWVNATVVAAGAFTTNNMPNDVLVRWNTGRLALYPSVDDTGIHNEVQLAPAN